MDLSETIESAEMTHTDTAHQGHPAGSPANAVGLNGAFPKNDPVQPQATRPTGMSYKFQRLREKLRQAITSGEFQGKLPGERSLAKRFNVNAKTLSKALTDLAAEGLLDRSIGRGTFVKGSAPAPQAEGRWLVVCDAGDENNCLIDQLRAANPQVDVSSDVTRVRPSFLNQFNAVIDLAGNTPEPFLRDLVVRNVPVVAVGREPKAFSMHAVLPDLVLGVSRIGRDLLLGGHRRFAAVEPAGSTLVAQALRQAAGRYAPDATVDACSPDDVTTLVDEGVTAIVCHSTRAAEQVKGALERRGVSVPADVTVTAVGCSCAATGEPPCSGYYVDCRQLVETAIGLLRDTPARPATLWLAGEFNDRGTIGAASTSNGHAHEHGQADPLSLRLEGVLV